MSISEKIVGLRIAARRATMCENIDRLKNTLSLKTKILFLIKNGGLTPADIMDALLIAKTNVAIITGQMAEAGLLTKERQAGDKREIVCVITQKGREYLQKRLDIIENSVQKAFFSSQDYAQAQEKLEEALNIFSFLQ